MMIFKKGLSIHWLALILGIALGVGSFVYYYIITEKPVTGNYIGEFQLNLVNNFQKADRVLLYIDQSAKYAAYQTAYDLAQKGGFYYDSECGNFLGYNMWFKNEDGQGLKIKDCYPNENIVRINFLNLFDDKLGDYLADYRSEFIPGSYDYEVNGALEIKGTSKEDVVIDIINEKSSAKATKSTKIITTSKPPTSAIGILKIPMKSNPDVETVKEYHLEVWEKYVELCKRMGIIAPGPCKSSPTKCCITSAYRHPAYNKKEDGARNSAHQYAMALDIYVGSTKEQLRWVREIDKSKLFNRAAIYPYQNDIHVDMMPLEGEYAVSFWIGDKGRTIATASNVDELEKKLNQIAIT